MDVPGQPSTSDDEVEQQPVSIGMPDRASLNYPPINLYHLSRLTDDTGILQHAVYTLPNYHEGYTTDDNARGLIMAIYLEGLGDEWFTGAQEFASRYLAFLWYAFDRRSRKFRNFLSYNRSWLEKAGSEDSQGRAIWGLGVACGRTVHKPLKDVAERLLHMAMPAAADFISPRPMAFTIIGLDEYLKCCPEDDAALRLIKDLAYRLLNLYRENRQDDWRWFEQILAYANSRLPQALLAAGERLRQAELIETGQEALSWLAAQQQSPEGYYSPIGSNGFYVRGKERAHFDQQPIEASGMVSACLRANRITGEHAWVDEAERAFQWFLGVNDIHMPLYDPLSGGCRDGIHPDRVNQNQGAESTLSFLLALLEMRLFHQSGPDRDNLHTHIRVLPVDPQNDPHGDAGG